MNLVRIIHQGDSVVLDEYIKEHIVEFISSVDLNGIHDVDILEKVSKLFMMKRKTKVELWRRTKISCFKNSDLRSVMDYVNEDEMIEIVSMSKVGSRICIIEKAVDKKWDRLILHIARGVKLRHEVSDVGLMERYRYILSIAPNFPVAFTTVETYSKDIECTRQNLLTPNGNTGPLRIPVCNTPMEYKIMLDNYATHPNVTCTCAPSKKYIHHMLFLMILGKDSKFMNKDEYILNISVMDYLSHLYPNSIKKLYEKYASKIGYIRSICIRYYPGYLDPDVVASFWNKYYRMHILRPISFSDVLIS